MRAVIYARYSTDMQRDASLSDQVELCRRYAVAQGWTLVETYTDAARSGADKMRPGFQQMLADARAGRFDVLVCEAIDRLGRNLSDVSAAFDELQFARIAMHTLHRHYGHPGPDDPLRYPRQSAPWPARPRASRPDGRRTSLWL